MFNQSFKGDQIKHPSPDGENGGQVEEKSFTEEIKQKISTIELDLKKTWGFPVDTLAIVQNPTELNWNELKQKSIDKEVTEGTFTINRETLDKNYNGMIPTIVDISDYIGKPRAEVFQSIIEQYSKTHYIPDYSYLVYLRDNPDQIPESMKKGNHYYAPSTVIGANNSESVPCVEWDDHKQKLNFYGLMIDGTSDGNACVLLLPREVIL